MFKKPSMYKVMYTLLLVTIALFELSWLSTNSFFTITLSSTEESGHAIIESYTYTDAIAGTLSAIITLLLTGLASELAIFWANYVLDWVRKPTLFLDRDDFTRIVRINLPLYTLNIPDFPRELLYKPSLFVITGTYYIKKNKRRIKENKRRL